MKEQITRKNLEMERLLTECLQRAQQKGEIEQTYRPTELALVLLNTLNGVRLMERFRPIETTLADKIAWFRSNGLLPPAKSPAKDLKPLGKRGC